MLHVSLKSQMVDQIQCGNPAYQEALCLPQTPQSARQRSLSAAAKMPLQANVASQQPKHAKVNSRNMQKHKYHHCNYHASSAVPSFRSFYKSKTGWCHLWLHSWLSNTLQRMMVQCSMFCDMTLHRMSFHQSSFTGITVQSAQSRHPPWGGEFD